MTIQALSKEMREAAEAWQKHGALGWIETEEGKTRLDFVCSPPNVLRILDALDKRTRALETIVKHQEVIGGTMAEVSTTAMIARAALEE